MARARGDGAHPAPAGGHGYGGLLPRRPKNARVAERLFLRSHLPERGRRAGILRHDRDHRHVHLLVVPQSLWSGPDDRRRAVRRVLAAAVAHDVARVLRAPLQRHAAVAIRTWVALRSAFVAVVAWTGAGLLGMHKVAQPMLGWDLWTTFAVVVPIILFYVLLSGYVGVVISDFFQTLVIIGGVADAAVGRAGGLWRTRGSARRARARVRRGRRELASADARTSSSACSASSRGRSVRPWDTAATPRRCRARWKGSASCRRAMRREAAKMYVWTQVILFLMLALITLPALGAVVRWPGLRDGTHRQRARLRHAARSLSAGRTAGPGRERHPRVDHVDRQLEHELRRAGVSERRLQAIARHTGARTATT